MPILGIFKLFLAYSEREHFYHYLVLGNSSANYANFSDLPLFSKFSLITILPIDSEQTHSLQLSDSE